MADYTVVAADVLAQSPSVVKDGIAGVALTAGQSIYEESATGTMKLADANGATSEIRTCKGIALHAAAAGQPIKYATEGNVRLTPGAAVGGAGATVILSATPGGIAPSTDIATGHYTNVLGFLDSTGKILILSIVRSANVAA